MLASSCLAWLSLFQVVVGCFGCSVCFSVFQVGFGCGRKFLVPQVASVVQLVPSCVGQCHKGEEHTTAPLPCIFCVIFLLQLHCFFEFHVHSQGLVRLADTNFEGLIESASCVMNALIA